MSGAEGAARKPGEGNLPLPPLLSSPLTYASPASSGPLLVVFQGT